MEVTEQEVTDMSHPSRVRGLKLSRHAGNEVHHVSHPSRVRGLKPWIVRQYPARILVAPLTGAWIETSSVLSPPLSLPVAPLTGAWIET